jgi:hypothetical protein
MAVGFRGAQRGEVQLAAAGGAETTAAGAFSLDHEEECSFLKKEPKNFCSLSGASWAGTRADGKAFCIFFSKNKTFLT